MPVKVLKKGSLQSVAKAPTPSANKGESIKVAVKNLCYPSITDMSKYMGAMVLNPVIDWLEFGSPVHAALQDEIIKGLNATLLDDEMIKVLGPLDKPKVPKASGYKFAGYWTGTARPEGHVLIKYGPWKGQSRFIVICMNPSQMTSVELEAFWLYWNTLFINYPNLRREKLVTKEKTILRVDIAIDLLGVEPQSVMATMQEGKSTKTKVQIAYQSVSGRLETKYLPHVKGEGATEYYYDKRKERMERGADYPYGEKPMTRFEFRVETDRPVNDLVKLGSHFDKFSLAMFDRKALKGQSSLIKLFVELALMRTLTKALDTLVEDQEKTDCKAFFTKNLIEVWLPPLLRKGWKTELVRIGLADKTAAEKDPKKKKKKSKKLPKI